jgi:hypothetical protein
MFGHSHGGYARTLYTAGRLEMTAAKPDGASDHELRAVTEHCRTLKFKSQ